MMKKLLYIASAIVFTACGSTKETASIEIDKTIDYADKFAKTITAKDLAKHLFIYASDEFEGRNTGEPGQKKAVKYLKDFYITQQIKSPLGGSNYFQEVPSAFLSKNRYDLVLKDSENVLAFIKGSEKPDEIIIISAHLDHEGIKDGQIYNGADDDGSGTVAILEIAEAFKKAADAGKGPKRSVLFLHVTGEEKGLLGSKYYSENPIFPLKNTVTDLNIDMIGRVDKAHKETPNYVYLIGADKLSTELHNISEAMNKKYTNIALDYTYNDENDPNRFYYRSDHYNFAKHNIPVIFYFNGTHEDYHKPTDTADKINYELLENRTRLVFYTAWEIANRENRLTVDKIAKK
ncbi:M28 family peptidase [Tenacibaculum finnmarkense]|nr:peptidase M28 [Tenacibaculum dicentrarchi]MBE7645617.1 M28 family peptidase [Tenacibaculum finnmarkense genomovar ulcerans]MCG8750108.1 M28 family peptidase [Tenacibaculum finnmarkense]MBE7687662.1 M28 family peptidase [Tenacibaculum finnmarkense genomovar ulcerans]MCG8754230.1 M28 family peptidase [Tenacibaculum finnmarkense]